MELISIVVPIYNVEKYLRKCVESLLQQTYKNIQIILVDDGSTDESGKIADEYAEKHEQIEVYHKINGGLSDARNYGIKYAKGEYLCFIDSDDWVAADMVAVLYQNIKKYDADVSEAQYIRVDNEDVIADDLEEQVKVFDNIQASLNLRNYHLNQIVAWNKMYKKSCFNDILFPFGKIHEDEFTTYKIIYNSKKIVVSNKILFFYRNTPNSIVNKKITKKRLHVLEAYDEAISFYHEKKEAELKKLTIINYLYILLNLLEECGKHEDQETKEIKEIIKKRFINLYKEYWKILLLSRTGIGLFRYVLEWR